MKCNDVNDFKEFISVAIANKYGIDLKVSSIISDAAGIDNYIISIVYSDVEKLYNNVLSKNIMVTPESDQYKKYKDTLLLMVDRLKNGTTSPHYIIHEVSINYGLSAATATTPDHSEKAEDKDIKMVNCILCYNKTPERSANTFKGPHNYVCSDCEIILRDEIKRYKIRKMMNDDKV